MLFMVLKVALLIGFIGSSQANAGEFVLKVMSYNIKGLPLPWIDHDRYARMGKWIAELQKQGLGPDIVMLQEAFAKRTSELGREAGFRYRIKGPPARGTNINSGIEILSNTPFETSAHSVYDRCTGTDCWSNKGAQFARVQFPELPAPIDLYNTHMNADPEDSPTHLDQVQTLKDLVRATHREDNILISGGDFNFTPDKPEYRNYVQDITLMNAEEEFDGVGNWESSIDYVFNAPTPGFLIYPILFKRYLKDPTEGDIWSDHEAILVHYLIRW